MGMGAEVPGLRPLSVAASFFQKRSLNRIRPSGASGTAFGGAYIMGRHSYPDFLRPDKDRPFPGKVSFPSKTEPATVPALTAALSAIVCLM